MPSFAALVSVACFAGSVLGATYSHVDTYIGSAFLNGFSHEAIADPTHGRVQYVDQGTATRNNLTFTNSNTLVIRADSTKTLSASGPGRQSVRLQSNKQYSTHVTVWNVRHMPDGCATWPALWEVGNNWPNQGEIDVVEGANGAGPNQVTLHTRAGCTMPSRDESGSVTGNDCQGNNGCGVRQAEGNSYGSAFNNNGGGWWVMERTSAGIKVWFWPRNAGNVPASVRDGTATITTDGFGRPAAFFPATQCNIDSFFGPHNIIINITLCGDWAGNTFSSAGCPGDCVSYVNQNPSQFRNAYWDIASLRVYYN